MNEITCWAICLAWTGGGQWVDYEPWMRWADNIIIFVDGKWFK